MNEEEDRQNILLPPVSQSGGLIEDLVLVESDEDDDNNSIHIDEDEFGARKQVDIPGRASIEAYMKEAQQRVSAKGFSKL